MNQRVIKINQRYIITQALGEANMTISQKKTTRYTTAADGNQPEKQQSVTSSTTCTGNHNPPFEEQTSRDHTTRCKPRILYT